MDPIWITVVLYIGVFAGFLYWDRRK